MGKIIKLKEAINLSDTLRSQGKTVVLAGGCFDLLHIGHLQFLEKAKKEGNILMIALENDANVKRIKGPNRPINSQEDRAKILTALHLVDYLILLPEMSDFEDYQKLVQKLQPNIIAVTSKDPQIENKRRQAKMAGARVKIVSPLIKTRSTTKLAQILHSDTF